MNLEILKVLFEEIEARVSIPPVLVWSVEHSTVKHQPCDTPA